MSYSDPELLRNRIATVERYSAEGDHADMLTFLGGRHTFNAGANVFRWMGVTGSSTVSKEMALAAWLRAARKKLQAMEEA